MSKLSCNCSCSQGTQCLLFSVTASVIIGIITSLFAVTTIITVTPVFLWVVLGIAIVYLAITLLISVSICYSHKHSCSNTPLLLLLTGILGTILTAVILLMVEFVSASVLAAIITGALMLFFSLFITSAACLVRCFAGTEDYNDTL